MKVTDNVLLYMEMLNIMDKCSKSSDKKIKENKKLKRGNSKLHTAILILCNMILILGMVCVIIFYSNASSNQRNTIKKEAFCATVESMKQVSASYLSTEKGYVMDWAAYISNQHMTAEEALEYIRITNTQKNCTAHLVDMEDMSARSTFEKDGNAWVHCYDSMLILDTAYAKFFLEKMQEIFDSDSDRVVVLGKYRVGEQQQTVVSVGVRVTIREADGTDKPYLLLRLIPVEQLQKSWAFPTEYPEAEISLISKDGGYVVSSASLRSKNFLEFIRAYNYPEDYNKINELADKLLKNDKELLEYKNSKGEECYFYYSSLGEGSNIDILGYIPVSALQAEEVDWGVVGIICFTIFLLIVLDGSHILSINHRLRKSYIDAESANMAKTQFLSAMSHDIRTPMNAVIGMTEIAKHHLNEPDYIKGCLDKVSMSGNHLLTLINDILDISKIESGKMTLNIQPMSIKTTIKEISEIINQSAGANGIEFKLDMHNITNDIVEADVLRIRQVLINLLTNAVKYTSSGGHVTFQVKENPVLDNDQRTELEFVITDDGMGMSEEFQKSMYESFSRATDSQINTIQGSGLGLFIVNQMVKLMNGQIACDSVAGKGTTFTVKLNFKISKDLKLETESYNVSQTEIADSFDNMRVLVAEDNEINWEILKVLLEEYGVTCDRVVNGKMCIEQLNSHSAPAYDLVMMDIQMPVMNGYDAARYIRSSGNLYIRSIPIVAITANAFADDIYACLQAGMDMHIAKPIDMQQILQVLRKVKNGTLHRKEEN